MATLFKTNYFDNLNRILGTSDSQPMIFLANPTGETLSCIKVFNNCKSQLSFLDKDTLTFTVPEHYFDIFTGDYVRTSNYDDIVKYRLLYTNGIGYYVITEVTDSGNGLSRSKEITAYSYEYSLSFKPADIFSTTSSEEGKMELKLSEILEACKSQNGWNYVISNTLSKTQRTFDNEIKENWWDFLTSTVSEAFDCFFIFDNESKKIYVYTQTEFEENYKSDLYLTHDYLLNEIKVTEVSDNITTVLKVEGADFDISLVNPLGSYIYNFDYFMNTKWMSQSLIDKIKAWQSKVSSLRGMYYDLMMIKNYLIEKKNDCVSQASIYKAKKEATADRLSCITDSQVIIKDFGEHYGKVSYSGALQSTWSAHHTRERMYYNSEDETMPSNYKDIVDMINILDKSTASPGGTPSEPIVVYTSIADKILILPTRVWSINSGTPNPTDFQNQIIYDFVVDSNGITWTISPPYQLENGTYAYGYYARLYNTADNETESRITQSHLYYAYNIVTPVSDSDGNFVKFENKTDENNQKISVWSLADIRHKCSFEQNFTSKEIAELQKFMIYDTYSDDNYSQEDLTGGGILPTKKRNLANQLYEVGVSELRRKSFPKYKYDINVNNFISLNEYREFCKQLSMGHTVNIEMPSGEFVTPSLGTCDVEFDNINTLSLQFVNSRDVKTDEMTFNTLFRNTR